MVDVIKLIEELNPCFEITDIINNWTKKIPGSILKSLHSVAFPSTEILRWCAEDLRVTHLVGKMFKLLANRI